MSGRGAWTYGLIVALLAVGSVGCSDDSGGPALSIVPDREVPTLTEDAPTCATDAQCADLAEGACRVARCEDGRCTVSTAPEGSACDDGNPCTVEDACTQGVCVGDASGCGCSVDGDCAAVDDDDLCNGVLTCQDGLCQVEPGSGIVCEGGDACAPVACEPSTGECVDEVRPDGVPCEDGDACTAGDTCQGGACLPGAAVTCEAGGPCEEVACDPEGGCLATPLDDGTSCSDGNPCTEADACQDGVCQPGESVCECVTSEDCEPFVVDHCGAPLLCQDGQCVPGDGPVVTCEAPDDPCLEATCDPATGTCVEQPLTDGAACGEGAACAAEATCQDGACVLPAGVCDDANPCTQDVCDPLKGCGHLPVEGTCDDGDPCTGEGQCVEGACVAEPVACECAGPGDCTGDGFDPCLGEWACEAGHCALQPGTGVDCSATETGPCEVAACDAATGGCVVTPAEDGLACDDGNPCTTGTTCSGGVCGDGAAVSCDDDNPCTNDKCSPDQGCQHTANNAPCDDGNACTQGDHCLAGACSGGSAVECPDEGPCRVGQCDPEAGCGVVEADDGAVCDDGESCTAGDQCVGGECVGESVCECVTDQDCPDDGNVCNGVSVCEADKCVVDATSKVQCPDQGPCLLVACDPVSGQCVATPAPEGQPCDPGACRTAGACQAGQCVGEPVVCDDANPCTHEACDPGTGECVATPQSGAACDDGDPCSTGDQCLEGQCQGTGTLVCGDGNACTKDVCEAGVGCAFEPRTCHDGKLCTSDSCDPDSGCVYEPVACVGTTGPCEAASCDPATGECVVGPAPPGTSCDDGDACTDGDVCGDAGACAGPPLDCDDGDACTSDACAAGACTHEDIPDCVDPCEGVTPGGACDDGDPETVADMCLGGLCRGWTEDLVPGGVATGALVFRHVDHAFGRWFVAVEAVSSPLGDGGVLATWSEADGMQPHMETAVADPYLALGDGVATDGAGNLWVFLDHSGSWSDATALSNAFEAAGGGTSSALWSTGEPELGLTHGLWLAGQDGNDPFVRHCTVVADAAGGVQGACDTEADDANTGGMPGALAGVACGPDCMTAGVMGVDFKSDGFNTLYYNDTLERTAAASPPWDYGYFDEGASSSRTRDAVAMPDGRFLVVGTGGYLRVLEDAEWSQNLVFVEYQQTWRFESVYVEGGAVIMAAWRPISGGQRRLQLWTMPVGGTVGSYDAWTVYDLAVVGGEDSGLFGLAGDGAGTLRAVGSRTAAGAFQSGVVFTREVP